MPGRTSEPYGHPGAPTPVRPRPAGLTPTARGVAAAVLAIAALVTAANAGPARAADHAPAPPAVGRAHP